MHDDLESEDEGHPPAAASRVGWLIAMGIVVAAIVVAAVVLAVRTDDDPGMPGMPGMDMGRQPVVEVSP